jgi:3-methyladenine DNA glycosylase AlkC
MDIIGERFSLKDHLFNEEKIDQISHEIKRVYPNFDTAQFKTAIMSQMLSLELMERVYMIRDELKKYLPSQYRVGVSILLQSLPPEADRNKGDDDFGDFIYLPYGFYVSEYGCTEKDLIFSLAALKQLTTRFSVEGPIRSFLNTFPDETLATLKEWALDSHYHVRRAASEGTRPLLPWAKRISIPFQRAIPILDQLYADPTRFVTRSVANHVNDIAKIEPAAAIALVKKWKRSKLQKPKEMDFILKHSMRSLVKGGDAKALALLGYVDPEIAVRNVTIDTPEVTIGESLSFSFDIVSKSKNSQQLMIDYAIHFNKANSTMKPKVYKLVKKTIEGGGVIRLAKKHPLKIMTTQKLYPGEHALELRINGQSFGTKSFELT